MAARIESCLTHMAKERPEKLPEEHDEAWNALKQLVMRNRGVPKCIALRLFATSETSHLRSR